MLNHESDPREVAAKYRVKKDEEGKFQICSEQGSSVNLNRNHIIPKSCKPTPYII